MERRADDTDETTEVSGGGDGPAPEDLESDPAYSPEEEELKDIKGG